ncbi:hypothetical protein PR202_gb26226 [Eleusine coracana subsp. coracana]|uniref:Uncharacterized protein n=1 Tax=Eleusine coracana subsp. coracana TaxID=191504 RepID=A0AAV5FS49_ELECO|nr:hypothetical protein PR202_gb26226 [Eleusine coracana subsp. coracana]
MDARRRAYIWSGEEKTTGAVCIVAWDKVTTSKHYGGFGVRNLRAQNQCLLLKLLHRLHSATGSSWTHWVRDHVDLPTMDGDLAGEHWSMLRHLLPIYQNLTVVDVGDGATTSFWRDDWFPMGRLSNNLPALYSHCIKPAAAVRTIIADGLRAHLVPRLTQTATQDLLVLEGMLNQVVLTDNSDCRRSPLIDAVGKL